MKKLVCLIAVFALTAPVMADITITTETLNDGKVKIGYTTDDPCSLPVGIGLILDAGADDIEECVVDGANVHDIYIDYASDDPCTYGLGDGIPTAKANEAGSLALPAASPVALCMGILDDQNDPPASGTLCKITACDATITISADPLRGGIVDQNGNAMASNLPIVDLALGPCDGICPGDMDGNGSRTLNDLSLLSQALFGAGSPFIVPIPPGNPAGDIRQWLAYAE